MSRYKDKRLSPWRVILGLSLVAGLVYFGLSNKKQVHPITSVKNSTPWFAGYVDATAKPIFAFEQLGSTNAKNIVLSFIVAHENDPCTPSWGSTYTLDQANNSLDLDRRIARLRQQNGELAISFGGLLNNELATNCKDLNKLKNAYHTVIDRYQIDTIDLDLEQGGLTNQDANLRRAKVIAELQKEYRSNNKNLAVWVTLPVAPSGLTQDGTNAVTWLLQNNVDLAGINLMTMEYGSSLKNGVSMADGSIDALENTHRQLQILYKQAGIFLSDQTVWGKIGATPMIGQNSTKGQIFTLKDAKTFNAFAKSKGISRMSIWSANRDLKCGDNYVDLTIVSDSCSGVDQQKLEFTSILGVGFEGKISSSSSQKTINEPDAKPENIKDDPTTSPYQIWSPDGTYLEGTKVVWRKNVYQSKWWTQGDLPDNPVLQGWQTPWELIGPVLPGEVPIKQPTLPKNTYPDWSGDKTYNTNDRVIFENTPYQAKWWNKGESPAAASSKASESPWAPLSQAQINKILEKAN